MFNKAFHITSQGENRGESGPMEDDYQKHVQDFREMVFRKVQKEQTNTYSGQIQDLNERVRLSEGVQAMEIEEPTSFWDFFNGLLRDMEIFQMILSLLTAIFFIISTYIQLDIDGSLTAVIVIDLMFSFLFSIFLWTNCILAKNK